jgi:arsenate reductase
MAEGFLISFDSRLKVFSAGTKAESKVSPFAVKVMGEEGVNISMQKPEPVEKYLKENFDYVITVCDGAKEICPVFTGEVKNRLHMGFEDPADAKGDPEEVLLVYRKVRDQIKEGFLGFYQQHGDFD